MVWVLLKPAGVCPKPSGLAGPILDRPGLVIGAFPHAVCGKAFAFLACKLVLGSRLSFVHLMTQAMS